MIVIFDLDGTVWDSEPGIVACLEHTFRRLELTVPARDTLLGNVGPPLQFMLGELGVPEHRLDDGVRIYRERYLSDGVYEASLYEGVVDLLDQLLDAGHRLGTATSKGEVPTAIMLDHFGIADRFEVVGAASMDTSAVTKTAVLGRTLDGFGRPDPDDCWLIGDRVYDVEGAAAHHLRCVGAAWGYGGADELRMAGATAIAAQPADVPGLIERR